MPFFKPAHFIFNAAAFQPRNNRYIYRRVPCGGGAYFISSFFRDYSEISVCLSADGLVSLFAFLGIILTGLHPFTYGGISVGHIAALALILTAAKYGGVLSGAVSGVTAALSLVFSGAPGEVAVIYAFTGVLGGHIFHLWQICRNRRAPVFRDCRGCA